LRHHRQTIATPHFPTDGHLGRRQVERRTALASRQIQPAGVIEQTVVCGVWNGQRGLFLLSELDPKLGLVKPNDFACSSGLIFQHNFEIRRNTGRGLNLQARAVPGEIPNCARDGMLSEKDLPGFQQTPARWLLPSVQRARQLRRPHAAMVGLS
jgi:hypothetical protein